MAEEFGGTGRRLSISHADYLLIDIIAHNIGAGRPYARGLNNGDPLLQFAGKQTLRDHRVPPGTISTTWLIRKLAAMLHSAQAS